MSRIRGVGGVVVAILLTAVIGSSCGARKENSPTDDAKTKTSPGNEAAQPVSDSVSSGMRPVGTVAPRAPGADSSAIEELKRKLMENHEQMVTAGKALEEAQEKALRESVELNDLKNKIRESRKALTVKVEALPEIRKMSDDKEAKQKELRDMTAKRVELRRTLGGGKDASTSSEYMEIQKKSSELSREINALSHDISAARQNAYAANPDIKTMKSGIAADEQALADKLNEMPDVKGLREKMMQLGMGNMELQKKMTEIRNAEAKK